MEGQAAAIQNMVCCCCIRMLLCYANIVPAPSYPGLFV